MIVLLDLVKLHSNITEVHPNMTEIEIFSEHGHVTLEITSTSSARDLALCRPVCTEWKAMLVLGPLMFKGVEVFSYNWVK